MTQFLEHDQRGGTLSSLTWVNMEVKQEAQQKADATCKRLTSKLDAASKYQP